MGFLVDVGSIVFFCFAILSKSCGISNCSKYMTFLWVYLVFFSVWSWLHIIIRFFNFQNFVKYFENLEIWIRNTSRAGFHQISLIQKSVRDLSRLEDNDFNGFFLKAKGFFLNVYESFWEWTWLSRSRYDHDAQNG